MYLFVTRLCDIIHCAIDIKYKLLHSMVYFEEDGEPKSIEEQERAGAFTKACKSSIRDQLREIGTQNDPPNGDEGRMIERTGVTLHEREVELLGDLLKRMLRYRPEERIKMIEVIRHPWFDFVDC